MKLVMSYILHVEENFSRNLYLRYQYAKRTSELVLYFRRALERSLDRLLRQKRRSDIDRKIELPKNLQLYLVAQVPLLVSSFLWKISNFIEIFPTQEKFFIG